MKVMGVLLLSFLFCVGCSNSDVEVGGEIVFGMQNLSKLYLKNGKYEKLYELSSTSIEHIDRIDKNKYLLSLYKLSSSDKRETIAIINLVK